MKTIFRTSLMLLFVFTTTLLKAQAPQKFPYQSVLRNSTGNLIANQNVSLRLSILDGSIAGNLVYQEVQNTTTNSLGLFNLNIGEGVVTNGSFNNINWGSGSKYLKIEMDASGGTNYVLMGNTQLLSVPYALYANVPGVPGPQGPQGPAGNGLNKAKLTYQVSSGSGGGAAIANAWTTRALNTLLYNDFGITLSSNQISLPPGTYEVSAYCVFNNADFKVNRSKIRIRNVTANTTVGISLNSALSVAANYSAYPVMINSERFTLNTNSKIELQYYTNYPEFGFSYSNPGQAEVYAEVILTKLQ